MRHRGMFALILCSAISYTPHILAAVEQGPMFVLSVLVSSSDGVWCGTEGEGLYHCVDREKGWVRDKEFEAIGGTNVFALCEDAYGRIWAGTLDSGVCIKDRLGWHRLSIEEGLSGCHVFALGADADGNVWIATESGVDRYSTTSVSLTFYDRSTGQISSIVIDRLGNVLLGTACNGLYKIETKDTFCARVRYQLATKAYAECDISKNYWVRDTGYREKMAKQVAGYNAAWRYHCTYGNADHPESQYWGEEEDLKAREARK